MTGGCRGPEADTGGLTTWSLAVMFVRLNVVLERAARQYGRGSTLDDDAESTYCPAVS
jgi:hypothetical protein